MHQMIPHHENAVNMARVLLKNPGDEELDEEVGVDIDFVLPVGFAALPAADGSHVYGSQATFSCLKDE